MLPEPLKRAQGVTIIVCMTSNTTSSVQTGGSVSISLNGDMRAIPAPATVDSLLAHLGLARGKIAVERNLEIVPKSRYADTAIGDGDRIEIVQFVGGG